ncbi:hypothetical protein BC938DRAFT_471507 [Jimgerdemannia flammicorona]|uniref:Uncharacterized protein n=1 Tax=Jimgerdemannia flammicorona TaxID=994334 RepID=A0A433QUK5_9FUNG|nr:hypothetical protein BC938DRAFT_471507 [Jimgerdemannia flammicorona]
MAKCAKSLYHWLKDIILVTNDSLTGTQVWLNTYHGEQGNFGQGVILSCFRRPDCHLLPPPTGSSRHASGGPRLPRHKRVRLPLHLRYTISTRAHIPLFPLTLTIFHATSQRACQLANLDLINIVFLIRVAYQQALYHKNSGFVKRGNGVEQLGTSGLSWGCLNVLINLFSVPQARNAATAAKRLKSFILYGAPAITRLAHASLALP